MLSFEEWLKSARADPRSKPFNDEQLYAFWAEKYGPFAGPEMPTKKEGENLPGVDTLISLGQGALSIGEGIGTGIGLLSGAMDNPIRTVSKDWQDWLQEKKSTSLQEKEAARAQKMAGADGIVSSFWTGMYETAKDPQLLANTLVSFIPSIAATFTGAGAAGSIARGLGATGKALTGARFAGAVGTGAAMQGADVASSNYDRLMSMPTDVWEKNPVFGTLAEKVGEDQAKHLLSVDLATNAGAMAAGISLATQLGIPGGATIERAIARGLSVKSITRELGETIQKAAPTMWRGALKGGLGEALQESLEEGGGQYVSNLMAQQVDPSVNLTENVGGAAGLGFLGGLVFGSAFGAVDARIQAKLKAADKVLEDGIKKVQEAQDAESARQAASAASQVSNEIITDQIPGLPAPTRTFIETPSGLQNVMLAGPEGVRPETVSDLPTMTPGVIESRRFETDADAREAASVMNRNMPPTVPVPIARGVQPTTPFDAGMVSPMPIPATTTTPTTKTAATKTTPVTEAAQTATPGAAQTAIPETATTAIPETAATSTKTEIPTKAATETTVAPTVVPETKTEPTAIPKTATPENTEVAETARSILTDEDRSWVTRIPDRWEGYIPTMTVSGNFAITRTNLAKDSADLKAEIGRMLAGIEEKKKAGEDIGAFTGFDAELAPHEMVPGGSAVVGALNAMGIRARFYRQTKGSTINGFVDQNNTVWINVAARSPLMAVAFHEATHVMESTEPQLYEEFVREMRAFISQKDLNVRAERYKSLGDPIKETVADFAGEMATRESFWKHLANRSPKVFARLASSVLKFFGDLIAALKKNTLPMAEVQAAKADALAKTVARHIAKYAEIRQAKREAAEEQARQEEAEKADERMARAVEALPEAGINLQEAEPVPAPQEVVRTKPKSKQAEDEPRGLNELIPEVTGIDLQNEDYRGPRLSLEDERPQRENLRLDINRAERVVAQGTLSDEEVKTLRAAAARHGLNEQEVLDKARQLKGRFPESEGWAPLTITGVEDVRRTGEKVKYNIAVQSIPYSFNVPPGGAPRRGHDQAWLNSVADKIIGEVAGIYDRAQRGDRNAQTIMRHANWYNNVAELLRRVMGGAADVFADLLGAMSPQTTVEQNFRYAEHAIQRLSRGDFDAQLRRLQQWLDNGNKLTDFPEHDKIRQASGALFGIGSDAGALAMLNAWRQIEAGQTPKARNFVLNLLKLSNLATIDLWAARFVQRMANALSGEHPRIPPVAERGVSGKWTVSRRESDITGQYGFAAEALRIASEQLTAQGIRLSPPELQAVVWFAEKELWGSRGWTTRAGEGGSFEEELNRRDWDRYVVGVSAQSDMRPSDAVVARAQASLLAPLVGDDNVVAFRAMPTVGAFGGDVERSFDMELTTERAFDPFNLISAVARVAKNRKQKTVFISRVLRPHEKSDNARPGLEVYFKTGVSLEAATQVADQLRGLQVDGFTFVVDQRESLRTAPGGDPQQFIGLRVQYVPEYDAMWNEEARRVLGSGDEKAIRNWMEDRAAVMQEAVLEISENESVAYANVVRYDTLVLFQGDYDGYVGRRAEERHRASGEKVWPRKTLRENVEAAISRHTGEQGQDAVRNVDGVGAGLSGEGAPRLSLAGSAEPAVRPGAKADGGDGVSVTGVHFSTQEKLAALSGSRFGQGLSGRERERVYRASDPRIKRRIYFYVAQKGAEFNVKRREAGLGPYAYSAELTNLYDPSVHPEVKYERAYINREFGILDADENLNRMESAILDAGYDGYVVHRPDIAVVMNKDVPVKYLGRLGQEPKINFRFSIDEEFDYSDIPLPVSDDETLSEKINRDLEEVRAKRGMTDDDYREIGREWLKIAQDKKRFSYKFSDQDDLANVAFDMSGTKVRVKTGPASSSDIQYYSADGFRPYKTHVLTVKNKWKARVYEAKDGRVALNVADFKQGESEGSLVYQIVGTWAANSGKTFIGDPAGLSNRALVRRAVNMFSNALRTRTTKHLEPHEFQRQAGLKWRKGDDAFNIGQLAVWIRDIMALYAPHSYAEASGREFDAADPYRGYGDFRPAAPLHAKTAAGGKRTASQVAVTDSLLAGVVGVEGGEAGGGIGVRPALRPDGADVEQLVGRATLYSLPVDKLFLSAAGEKSLGLYSALQRGIQNIKTEVAPPSAWMSAIRNLVNTGKVKKQEVFWSGIEEFLDLREKSKEKVSKEEILNVIEQGVGYQEDALGPIGLEESLRTNFQIKKVGDNASTLLGKYFDALVYEVYDSDAAAMESLEGEKLREQEKASAKILNLHDFFKENPSKVTEKEIRDAFREYAKVAGKFFLYSQEDFETPLSEWYVAFPKNQNESASAFGRTKKQVWQRLSRAYHRQPSWEEISTKGGSDYSEILLLTGSKKTGGFRSSHFDTAGTSLIAHIRLKQYLDKNQNPILFIEEIQSDWAQEGRKKGFFDKESDIDKDKVIYQSTGKMFPEEYFWAKYDHNGKTIISAYAKTKQQALEDLVDELRAETVRHGPFVESTDSWVSLAVKKIILTAINNGFEGIAWTSGDQQAFRNRHFVKSNRTRVYKNKDGTFNAYSEDYELWKISLEEGKQRLGDWFEPFVADMKEGESRYYNKPIVMKRNFGAKKFYDEIVPQNFKSLIKKYGIELTKIDLTKEAEATGSDIVGVQPGFYLNSNIIKDVVERGGLPMFSITGDSKRDYTPEQREFFKRTGRDVPEMTMKERVAWWRKEGWKAIRQGVFDVYAPIKDLSFDAYTLLRLIPSHVNAFEILLKHGKVWVDPDEKIFRGDRSGGFIQKIGIPLKGEVDDFLWWVAAHRAENLMAVDRENLFTKDDIRAGKSLANGDMKYEYTFQNGPRKGQTTKVRKEAYDDALITLNEFNKTVLDVAEQSGLIDGSTRKFWEDEFYVPFYRVSQEEGFIGPAIKSGAVRQEAFKKLKGGTDKLNNDLLSNVLMNWAHLLEASAKSRAANATMDAAVAAGAAVEASEETVRAMGKSIGRRNNVVWIMDGGRRRFFIIGNDAILHALVAIEYFGIRGPIMDVLSKAKYWFTVAVTASPHYKIRNLIRDTVHSIAVSDLSYNPIKNVIEGIKSDDHESQDYLDALAAGGLIRFGTMVEGSQSARTRQLVKQGVKESTILDSESKLRRFWDTTLEPALTAYNELGNRGEEINRMALYKQLRAQGVSRAKAALMARDLMDFSLQGRWGAIRFLAQVVPLFNSRLQSMYKLGRATKENPRRVGTVVLATALLSLSLLAAYHDDDDWKRREDWDRDNYWWFKFGGTAFRIPKPFEIGAIATIAERGAEWFFDPQKKGGETFKQIMNVIQGQLSMNIVPQAIQPIMEVYANRDSFTGRPIESLSDERLRADYRYGSNTSMVARGVSSLGQGALRTAGLERLGYSFLSPKQIDHLIQGYFAWLGSMAIVTTDAILRPMTDSVERPARDWTKTLSGGMIAEITPEQSRFVTKLYDQMNIIEEAYGTYRSLLRTGRLAEAQEFYRENTDTIARYSSMAKAKRNLSLINQQIRIIEQSNLDAQTKRERIMRLKETRNRIAETVVE